jgi:hypothetical protein
MRLHVKRGSTTSSRRASVGQQDPAEDLVRGPHDRPLGPGPGSHAMDHIALHSFVLLHTAKDIDLKLRLEEPPDRSRSRPRPDA